MNFFKNLLLVLISSYLIIFTFEIVLEINNSSQLSKLKLIPKEIDEKEFYFESHKTENLNKYEKYKEFKDQGLSSNLFFNIHSIDKIKNENIFPLAYKPNTHIISCIGDEGIRISKTDKFGFFNKNYYYDNPEIILLGDSYVAGQCVSEKDQINSILNIKNSKYLSYGLPGSSILKQYAAFMEYKKELNIKKVILFTLLDNDFKEIVEEYKNPYLKKYLQKNHTQNLSDKKVKIESIYSRLNENLINELKANEFLDKNLIYNKKKFFNIKQLISLYNSRKLLGITNSTLANVKGLNLYIETLEKLNNFLKAKDIELSIFLIGSDFKVNSKTLSEIYLIYKLEDYAKNNDINFINLLNIAKNMDYNNFYDNGPHPIYKQPGHPNKNGYVFIASQIEKYNSK